MFHVRYATALDLPTIARHRAEMFRDMGTLPAQAYPALVEATMTYLERALPTGEYVGWLAVPVAHPDTVVGGAGLQLRRILPFPYQTASGSAIGFGRQGLVLNVFTEEAWRYQGVARLLMETVLEWARVQGLESVVLHASAEARGLYERLGFAATNELRFRGPRSSPTA